MNAYLFDKLDEKINIYNNFNNFSNEERKIILNNIHNKEYLYKYFKRKDRSIINKEISELKKKYNNTFVNIFRPKLKTTSRAVVYKEMFPMKIQIKDLERGDRIRDELF